MDPIETINPEKAIKLKKTFKLNVFTSLVHSIHIKKVEIIDMIAKGILYPMFKKKNP